MGGQSFSIKEIKILITNLFCVWAILYQQFKSIGVDLGSKKNGWYFLHNLMLKEAISVTLNSVAWSWNVRNLKPSGPLD